MPSDSSEASSSGSATKGSSGGSSSSNKGGAAVCWCFLGLIALTGAITGGVVSSWPAADRSKGYTDRTVRNSLVSNAETTYLHLDKYHPRQMDARRQLPSASMAGTSDAISIVPLPHNMELIFYCYTESEQSIRCDLYFNNPDNFEYWKEDNQCLAYTIGAPKTASQKHQCSFFSNDKSSDGKTPTCLKSLNVCDQPISWTSTTCFKPDDTNFFSSNYAFEITFIMWIRLMVNFYDVLIGKIDLKNTRYTGSNFFQVFKATAHKGFPILQELILGRSTLVLHSTTSSDDNEVAKGNDANITVICSNGVPGNGPHKNYKPIEADESESSSPDNTATSSNGSQP
jgi:hypothetical protein